MKKVFIGIILFPVLIFAVGLVFVLAGKGWNFISPSVPSDKAVTKPGINYIPTQYYDAVGSTIDEIRASMTRARQDTFLEGHPAVTLVKTNINFTTRQLVNTCKAVMTKFDLDITYVYPRWTSPQGVSSDLVAKWKSFVAALKIHEEGHAKIEIERANILMNELQKLSAYPMCEDFNRAWRSKASAFEVETKQIEARYDRDTQSGKLQGAIF